MSKNADNTVHHRELVVYPCEHMPVWELQLLPLPSITREYCTTYQPRKRSKLKFEVQFLLNTYHYQTIIKSKNRKSNHSKSETIQLPPEIVEIKYIWKNLAHFKTQSKFSIKANYYHYKQFNIIDHCSGYFKINQNTRS